MPADTVFAYLCPGTKYRQGFVPAGELFTILGWDETEEEGERITWPKIAMVRDHTLISRTFATCIEKVAARCEPP